MKIKKFNQFPVQEIVRNLKRISAYALNYKPYALINTLYALNDKPHALNNEPYAWINKSYALNKSYKSRVAYIEKQERMVHNPRPVREICF